MNARLLPKMMLRGYATKAKKDVVVLGTGWAAARLARDLDLSKHNLVVISPRNHMVFTPLLASTTVGTLDFRSVAVSMRNIQPKLYQAPNQYYTAKATKIDFDKQTVSCKAESGEFDVSYDELAIATGAAGSTFGIPGVEEHALPLRDVHDADAIRNKLMSNICQR